MVQEVNVDKIISIKYVTERKNITVRGTVKIHRGERLTGNREEIKDQVVMKREQGELEKWKRALSFLLFFFF